MWDKIYSFSPSSFLFPPEIHFYIFDLISFLGMKREANVATYDGMWKGSWKLNLDDILSEYFLF
jgi:hypothetical protein